MVQLGFICKQVIKEPTINLYEIIMILQTKHYLHENQH